MKLFAKEKPTESNENINVSVRVRPFLKNEMAKGDIIFIDNNNNNNIDNNTNITNNNKPYKSNNKIKIGKGSNFYEGNYNKVFSETSTQSDVFDFVKEAIPDLINGINNTIFAYGQTGSGKTYTMFGSDWTNYEHINVSKVKVDKNGNIM